VRPGVKDSRTENGVKFAQGANFAVAFMQLYGNCKVSGGPRQRLRL